MILQSEERKKNEHMLISFSLFPRGNKGAERSVTSLVAQGKVKAELGGIGEKNFPQPHKFSNQLVNNQSINYHC